MTDPQGEREQWEWYARYVDPATATELQQAELWAEQKDLTLVQDADGARLIDPYNDDAVMAQISADEITSVLKAFLASRVALHRVFSGRAS